MVTTKNAGEMKEPWMSGLASKLVFAIYLVVAVAVLLEVTMRGYFAWQIGPRVLAYGTPWYRNDFGEHRKEQLKKQYKRELAQWNQKEREIDSVGRHNNAKGGYHKFFPNEAKYIKDIDTGEIIPVTINSFGIRGKEYTVAKPDDVIRVLTLGASSTFGYYNRDDETYPYMLEQRLNEACSGPKRFEVINFAIPDARADAIREMFVTEGLALDPDVITFYEGRNDSHQIKQMAFRSPSSRTSGSSDAMLDLWGSTKSTFLVARFLDEMMDYRAEVSAGAALESLDRIGSRTSKSFLLDLEEIRKLAEQRNILFIVANQQANSKSWFGIPAAERLPLAGVTYDDEVSQIHRILQLGEPISGYEFNFLIHARLMQDLETWVQDNDLPFVDIIGLLDQDRHHMVSWVHLDAYANRLIASALAAEILQRECPSSAQ